MIKTGLEIVEMIAKGEAPKKIKQGGYIYEYNGLNYFYKDKPINLLAGLNDEFEITEDKVWKPKQGETYWVITNSGFIVEAIWIDDEDDELRYEVGNCFKTKEEAQKHLEKIKIYVKLKRYAEEHNEEKIDWNNKEQVKWHIYYDYYNDKMFIMGERSDKYMFQIYFTSEKIANKAIKEIGEDNIKKLFEEENNDNRRKD